MQRISNFQIPDHVEESRYIVNFQAEADNQTRGTKRIRVMKLISILLNAYYLSKNSIYPDINSPKLSVESLLSRYNYPNDTTAARRTIRGDIAAINSILRKSMVPLEVIINGNGEESEVWLQQLYASAENGRNRIAANLDSLKMNLTSLPLLSLIFDEFLGKPFSYREVAAALLKKQLPSANPTQEELTNLASQIESVLTSGASTYDQTLLGLESDSEAGESRYVVISTDEIVDTDDIDAYLSDMSTVVSSMESTLKALIQRVGSIVNVSDARRFANGNRSFKVDTSLALRIVRFRTGYTLLMRYVTSESEPIDEESISSIQNKMLYDEEGKFRHWVPLLPLYANLHNTALRLGFKSAEVMFTLMENGLYNQQLQIINQQRVSQNE